MVYIREVEMGTHSVSFTTSQRCGHKAVLESTPGTCTMEYPAEPGKYANLQV